MTNSLEASAACAASRSGKPYGIAFRLEHSGKLKSGETIAEITPEFYSDQVKQWLLDGTTVVGGCCEITPSHIKHLTEAFKANPFDLVRFSQLASRQISNRTL